MKKTLVWLLALCMTLSLASFTGAASAADAPIVITRLMTGDNTPTPDNDVLRAIEERTGIRMEVTYVPGADRAAKLNTMIAARTLPDIFGTSGAEAIEFRDSGMLMEIGDLLEANAPFIMGEVGADLTICPLNDGDGIYGFHSGKTGYSSNLSVRLDWLEAVGKEMPTDLDNLYDVLHAFTKNDPDGNGQDDTYGIVMSMAALRTFEHIFGAFGICVGHDYLMEDGTVTTYMKAPGYLDAIQFLRRLYQDGLMDPDFATLPQITAFERLWTGRVGMIDFQNVGTTNNWYPGRYTFEVPGDPAELFGFAIIKGEDGAGGPIKQYPSYTSYTVLSSTCKNPEAAVKLLDFLYSEEGDDLTYFGVEGVQYEWIDKEAGTYQRLGQYTDDATHRAAGAFVYNTQWSKNNAEVRTLNTLTREGQALAEANWVDYPYILQPVQASIDYGTQLGEITKEALANLIVTTGDVEAEYAAYVARWEAEGGLQVEAEKTAAYAAEQANR